MKEQPQNIPPENTGDQQGQAPQNDKSRNLGLSVLLIFSFVYNGILFLILVAGLFYPDLVNDILQQYYKQVYISPTASFLINLSSAMILGVSFYGLILLWRFMRKGFYYFAAAQIAILVTLIFVLKSYDWINTGIIILIIAIFGISSRNME